MWRTPSLSVIWPPFVRPSAAEEMQLVSLAATAKQAGLITSHMALEKLRPIFPFENIQSVVEQLEEEAKHRTDVEHMLAQAMKPSSPGDDYDDEDEDEDEDDAAETAR